MKILDLTLIKNAFKLNNANVRVITPFNAVELLKKSFYIDDITLEDADYYVIIGCNFLKTSEVIK